MKEKKKQYQDFTGAIIVMENFLDGALYDYEDGLIDNTILIEGCINALEVLGDYSAFEYRQRFESAKELRGENND